MKDNIIEIRDNTGGTKEFLELAFTLLSKSPKSSFEFSKFGPQVLRVDLTTLTKEDLDNLDILLNCFKRDLGIEIKDLNELVGIRNKIVELLNKI